MITYDDIKVGTFINASGTVTTLGGSLMPEPVVEAMVQASRSFVGLDELHERGGQVAGGDNRRAGRVYCLRRRQRHARSGRGLFDRHGHRPDPRATGSAERQERVRH